MVRTQLESNMTIDWDKMFNTSKIEKSIDFGGTGVAQAHAILFPRVSTPNMISLIFMCFCYLHSQVLLGVSIILDHLSVFTFSAFGIQ